MHSLSEIFLEKQFQPFWFYWYIWMIPFHFQENTMDLYLLDTVSLILLLWWYALVQIFFCALHPCPKHNARTHTHTRLDTHAQPPERTAIVGVDSPSGVPGFFPVGRSIMGRWTSVFFWVFFPAAPCLGDYDDSPGLWERHALARPTMLSHRHSREVTIGPVACLSKDYLAQWPYERLQRPRSPIQACSNPPSSCHI